MRIDSSDILAGQPLMKIREFLKYVHSRDWTIDYVTHKFAIDESAALAIVDILEKEGYIEKSNKFRDEQTWSNTLKGNSLAMATAAKPILRKSAEKILERFMERVREVNKNDEFLFKVKKVIVFGSYLSDKDKINDIDIAIELVHKEKDEKRRRKLDQEKISKARKNGRVFSNVVEEVCWPEIEVRRFLKSRSHSISLHDTHDKILEQVNYSVIYEE